MDFFRTTNIPDAYENPFTSGDIAVVNSIVLIMAVMGILGNTITVAVILHYRILRLVSSCKLNHNSC